MHIRGPRIQEGPPITKATTMNVFLLIAAAIILIVVLLRFKCPIGPAILAGGALLWLFEDPTLRALTEDCHDMLTMNRTYDLLFALYFVMCLEIQLRRSGTLKGMVDALNRFFSSTKVVISSMPAFLGLLPSVGGARFSAPIVETACEGMDIKPESKAAINFWFRHICEFASPIIPGMILGCAIAHVSVADLVIHLFWMSVVAIAMAVAMPVITRFGMTKAARSGPIIVVLIVAFAVAFFGNGVQFTGVLADLVQWLDTGSNYLFLFCLLVA